MRLNLMPGAVARLIVSLLVLYGLFLPGGLALGSGGAAPAGIGSAQRALTLPPDASQVISLPKLSGTVRSAPKLGDGPWRRAACIAGFVNVDGHRPAANPTWVYLYHDSTTLWAAFRCGGQQGSELKKEWTEHDSKVWRDDSVEIRLDLTGTGKTVYHFVINSVGALYDSCGVDAKWNGKPRITTSTDEKGWSAIVGIPFASVGASPPKPGQVWKANFIRNVALKRVAPVASAEQEVPPPAIRSCWCPKWPLDGGPEHFGYIVFREENAPVLRMRTVSPMLIGENGLAVDPLPGLRVELAGLDAGGRVIWENQPKLTDKGTADFRLSDDRPRRIRADFRNQGGSLLGRGLYPMLSPEVKQRVEALPRLIQVIEQALPRFPEKARQHAQGLIGGIKPSLIQAQAKVVDPAGNTPEDWEKLDKTVSGWELKLDGPSCLTRTLEKLPKAEFAVGLESSMRKVMIRDFRFGGRFDDHYDLSLARNEHEGLQVVVMPLEADLKNAKVSVSALQDKDGRSAPGIKATVSVVGHVKVTGKPPYLVDYQGWYPDPLLSFQQACDAAAGDNVAFWIDVATAKETPAGQYTATMTVAADAHRPVEIRLNLTVWDFQLPDGTHLRNAFSYNEPMVGRFYKERWTDEMKYKFYDFILAHRLNIDNIYRRERPDISVVRYGMARGMNAFNIGSEFFRSDRKDFAAHRKYIEELKKDDLFKYAYVYGFDEVQEEKFPEVKEVFDRVHRSYPGLKTMTTAEDKGFGQTTGLGGPVDIWVPLTDRYDEEVAKRLRRQGKNMWWYICVNPVHPYANFFIEFRTIESRLLTGSMSFKANTGGFLYYLINLWDNNHSVVGPGPYTDWDPGSFFKKEKGTTANGDGSLFCPGPDGPISTLRLENIRDGFEDYEYLWMLRERTEQIRKRPETAATRAFLAKADALLAVPDHVVTSPVAYTDDPKTLSVFREEVAAAILAAPKIIDGK